MGYSAPESSDVSESIEGHVHMLLRLNIRNIALAGELGVEFEDGLNILTGETGAGKSIIMGALALLSGGRASAEMIRSSEEGAVVEALF